MSLVEKWIDALRSGRYKQNKNSLISKDGCSYCVIGVLCDLIDPFAWRVYYEKNSERNLGFINTQMYWRNYSYSSIPDFVVKTLEHFNLNFNAIKYIMKLNDSGSCFDELADFIENSVKS